MNESKCKSEKEGGPETNQALSEKNRKIRSLGQTVLKWAIRRIQQSYWKPGDPITRFTVFDDDAVYDLSDTDGIIKNISKTTPVDVIGGTMTVFSPDETEKVLQALRREDETAA